jgi:hypothetical protein
MNVSTIIGVLVLREGAHTSTPDELRRQIEVMADRLRTEE